MSPTILDVREIDEFQAEHIDGAILCPISDFIHTAPGILNTLKDQDVLLMCRSGTRAKIALDMIQKMGYDDKIKPIVYDGGLMRWKSEGKSIITRKKSHLPLMRQVQLAAGSLVILTMALAWIISPFFLLGTAFIGVGLTVAGATGFCGMAILLTKMPWNKTIAKEEVCSVSPSSKACN